MKANPQNPFDEKLPTKEQARRMIADLQSHLISKGLTAVFKNLRDNGNEATVGIVITARNMNAFANSKDRVMKAIKAKCKQARFSFVDFTSSKGRIDQHGCVYVPYENGEDKPVKRK